MECLFIRVIKIKKGEEVNEKQMDQRNEALGRACGKCFICGKPLYSSFAQFSHRIANKEVWRKKYGSLIIDHSLNGEYTCCTEHNYKVDCGSSYGNHLEVIADIIIAEYKKMWGVEGIRRLTDKLLEEYKKLGVCDGQ